MKVWVVMGNDFPDAVFFTKASAEAYCERKRDEPKIDPYHARIYWRHYEFEVQP